jgi:hypothetical protein
MRHLLSLLIVAAVLLLGLGTSTGLPRQTAQRIDDDTDTTQTLTIPGVPVDRGVEGGAYLRGLQVDVTGAGSTVTFSLSSRICGSPAAGGEAECSGWETVAIASGSIAGAAPTPATQTIDLAAPRYQYRLVLTVTVGTPTAIRVYALYQ